MTDDEWADFEPFLIHRGGGRPPRNHRRVLDAVFWLMRTGAPWRDLPEEFGNWNSIFRQFRRWADSGIWDVILEGLAESGVADARLQMIDATIIRALVRNEIEERGGEAAIPSTANRKVQHVFDKALYTLRNRIERFFNRAKNSRRVATRYDKLMESFAAFVLLACIRIWIKFVHAT